MTTSIAERPSATHTRRCLDALPPGAVLLHAGQHKTGSTAIQNALAASTAALHGAGWIYPQQGRVHDEVTGHRHRQLMLELRDGQPPLAWAELGQALAGSRDRVLLSHEGFFAPQIEPTRLAALLPGREVHVLVYLRHPVDYLESSWREWVRRWRYPGDLRDWSRKRRGWMQVQALHDRWEAALGVGRVHVRPYVRGRLDGGSVVGDFARALGLPKLDAPPAEANPSLNARQALVCWMANRYRAEPAQRDCLAELVADAGLAAELRPQLAEMGERAGFTPEHTEALDLLLAGVQARTRLVDDALAGEVELQLLPGYLRLLRDQGFEMHEWVGDWWRHDRDPGLADARLQRAVRLLLGR